MVTISHVVGQGVISFPGGAEEAMRQRVIEGFMEKAERLGMYPMPLTLKVLGRGIMGWLNPSNSYRVGWHKKVWVSLLGLRIFAVS